MQRRGAVEARARAGAFVARIAAFAAAATLWAVAAALPGPALAEAPAKELFGVATEAAEGPPAAHGGYARGCLVGALRLAETGPDRRWQAMRLSRGRVFGHPEMIAYIDRLSTKAATFGWSGLLVGDIAQPLGGPMRTGHRSHQTGIDADIWLTPGPADRELTRAERESMSAVSMVASDRRTLTAAWTPLHALFLRAAAADPAVARVFVNPAIKKRLCVDETAAGGDTAWLRRVRPWWGHQHHVHVRLRCPVGSPGCEDQEPVPEGDGCAEVDGWLTDEALFPDPSKQAPSPPRPELTLADLPEACRALVGRP